MDALLSVSSLYQLQMQKSEWHASLIQDNLNGGRTTVDDLDRLFDASQPTVLTVSGLDQHAFEHLCVKYGHLLCALDLWKCPHIADFSPLEAVVGLTHIAIFWNQKAEILWDLRSFPRLSGLQFQDFTKLRSLDCLANASHLHELDFGDKISRKFVVPSLDPLRTLTGLKHLAFNPKAIADGRIEPIACLTKLEEIEFPTNLFRTEQLAWLRARLSSTVQSSVLQPFKYLDNPTKLGNKQVDVLVMGKGKPFLSSKLDRARIERYTTSFERLVSRYTLSGEPEPAP